MVRQTPHTDVARRRVLTWRLLAGAALLVGVLAFKTIRRSHIVFPVTLALSLIIALGALIWAERWRLISRIIAGCETGSDLVAIWEYSPADWERFKADALDRWRDKVRLAFVVVGLVAAVLGGVLSIIILASHGLGWRAILPLAVTWASVIGVVALIAAASLWNDLRSVRAPTPAFFSARGVVFAGQMLNLSTSLVFYAEVEGDELHLKQRQADGRGGTVSTTTIIPIPTGRGEEAEELGTRLIAHSHARARRGRV